MRKWFPGWCSECGREDGYWEDVIEGPETPERYAERIKNQEFWNAVWGPRIKLDLDSSLKFYSYFVKMTQEQLDQAGTITFPIRKNLNE